MMKQLLFFSILSILCLTISAQERTTLSFIVFTGNGDGTTWHDPNNWNPPQVPNNYFNATIPTGMTVTNEGTVIFINGTINGGGTLINNSVFSFSGVAALSRGTSNISIINNATLLSEVPNNPTVISGGTTITNTATGTITFDGLGMNSDSIDDKIINNGGVIRSITSFSLSVLTIIENNNGTISVENGNLDFHTGLSPSANTLNGGTYNVVAGSKLTLGNFTLGGTFSGQVDGAFGLQGYNFIIDGTLINEIGGNGLTFISETFPEVERL